MKQSRREFIKTASVVSAGTVINSGLSQHTGVFTAKTWPICVFTKCLQFLDYEQLGETLAKIGFNGAELTVRNGGHVLPDKVKTDLPKAVKALQKSDISVPMMVTGIINAEDPLTEMVLGTASEQGVAYYRMGYFSYDPAKSMIDNLADHKRAIDKLEAINRKFGIQGCYQNHSGTRVGGPVWDLYWLVNGSDPEYISVQYDIRHAVCEGGVSWPLGMKLLGPWIKTTAIKDFYWKKEDGKWEIENVPLGEGMIDFDAYFKEYVKLGISDPVTIHYEYDLEGVKSDSQNLNTLIQKTSDLMKIDLIWLRKKFSEYDIKAS